jgi:hypothetical protein
MAQNEKQPSALDGVKKSLGKAADLTSLKIKLRQTENRRKAAYQHLGELSYSKYRPRTDEVTEDIENAITNTVKEITDLGQAITELELRIKLVKAQMK